MTIGFSHARHDAVPLSVPAIGLELRVRLSPTTTGKALTVIETTNAPGFGPPLHRHREAEIFHVLAGRYLFEVDGDRFHADTGDVVSVPGGAAHRFVNVGTQPAHQYIVIMPGLDAVAFFTGLAATMVDGMPDPDALSRFGRQWGVEFLGPPLPSPAR